MKTIATICVYTLAILMDLIGIISIGIVIKDAIRKE